MLERSNTFRCSVKTPKFSADWSKQHDFVAATIVGVRAAAQMEPILKAAGLQLDEKTLTLIDEVSNEIKYPMG